jgi:16S rRNA (guanine527-N7)-methyltransferase
MLETLLGAEQIRCTPTVIDRLEHFARLLHEWNAIHNLTGARSIEAIYAHIVDSLYPLSFIDPAATILDVGTGAGFPGLVLAIAQSHSQVVLAEPLKKRASFLRYAVLDLGLEHVTVQALRVEALHHAPFALITSRAVTDTRLLLDMTAHLRDARSALLFYKGTRVFEEIEAVPHQLQYDIVQKNRRNYLYIKSTR